VIVSIIIRLKMKESPLFIKLKEEGKTSTNPLKESFGRKENFKMVLLALFGATMGQGVVWYTGQFYAQHFILTKCFVEYEQANTIILIALLMATPFFIVFGALSDRIGRKHIMMLGMLAAVLLYRPVFQQIYEISDTSTKTVLSENRSIRDEFEAGARSVVHEKVFTDGSMLTTTSVEQVNAGQASSPLPATKQVRLSEEGKWKIIGLVAVMVLFVTMVYGPIAAFLVELFPTRIRYTSMSLPYHIGNGVFGGMVPFIATLITTLPGTNHLSGLWYPIGVAALSLVIGVLYLNNRIDKNVGD
jgi:MFS family permease